MFVNLLKIVGLAAFVSFLTRIYVREELAEMELMPPSKEPRAHLRYSHGEYTVSFDAGADPRLVRAMFTLAESLNKTRPVIGEEHVS